jgi:O-antigen ligase
MSTRSQFSIPPAAAREPGCAENVRLPHEANFRLKQVQVSENTQPMLLAAILFAGILTMWIPDRWALSLFQLSLFAFAGFRLIATRSIGWHPVALLLASVALWGLIQLVTRRTIYEFRTLESILDWIANLAAFSLALELNRGLTQRKRFLDAILIFATLLGIVSVFTVLTSPVGRVFWWFDISNAATLGPFVYKNQYAAFVEAILPLAILQAIRDRRRWLPYTLLAATLFGSVIASGSRTGSALCLAEILVIPAIAFARDQIDRRTLIRATLGSAVAMTLLTIVVGWQVIWSRLQEANPYELRWKLVQSSLAMVHARPWTGFGLGTWSMAYPGYALFDDGTFVNQAHNDWLQWAVEGGIPLILIMLAVAIWTIRPALHTLWGIGICAVFLHCLIDYPMQQRPALTAFFFALLGTLASQVRTYSPVPPRQKIDVLHNPPVRAGIANVNRHGPLAQNPRGAIGVSEPRP